MRWMKVVSKDRGQRRYGGELRSYYNYGINGSGAVETYALRPGWHAGSLPTMRQIGKGPNKNLRDNRFVWVEGEVAADVDYQGEADANPDKDIPDRIPEDGYYLKATNADKTKSQADRVGWFVSGAFKANRIISDAEARRVIDQWNAEHPDQKVEYDYERESGVEFSEADAARVNGVKNVETYNWDNIKPIGQNRFGGIYDQFRGKAREAFYFLKSKKEGYLKGVFHRDDIGDIDLVWGDAPNDYNGKGLAHIIRKHIQKFGDFNDLDDAIATISDVINNGESYNNSRDARLVNIEKGDYRVVVAMDNEGNWVLSALDFVTPKKVKLQKKKERHCRLLEPPVSQMMRQVLSPQIFPQAKIQLVIRMCKRRAQKLPKVVGLCSVCVVLRTARRADWTSVSMTRCGRVTSSGGSATGRMTRRTPARL